MKKLKAFTLLELLLTIALISILFLLSAPIIQVATGNNEFEENILMLIRSVRTAQTNAFTSKEDSSWSIRFSGNGELIIFKGDEFSSRDQNFDIEYNLAQGIQISGTSEIIFQKNSPMPNNGGTITLTYSNLQKEIQINQYGAIIY